MRIRKLLDWRKLLICSHRWLGIGMHGNRPVYDDAGGARGDAWPQRGTATAVRVDP